jgi:RNA polymerase sigma-70 factor (ECF subfamily)
MEMDNTPASLLERLHLPGEETAWNRFVRLFTPLIYGVGRQAGLQSEDARDLVQDVFLLLARKMPEFQYDPKRSFRAWLRTVTLNKLRERMRRRQHRTYQAGDGVLSEVEDSAVCALLEETEYQQMLAARAMEVMRSEFTPTTWQACWEHVVSGRKAAEVGAELGISEGAVYVAKYRVLQSCRDFAENCRAFWNDKPGSAFSPRLPASRGNPLRTTQIALL